MRSRISSHIRSRYSQSRLISGLGRLAPAVRTIRPMPRGMAELGGHLAQPLAVGGRGDLARDAAAARRVRHQHAVAAGERDVGGERRALGAALLLDHLHQQDLAAADHFLDLVVAQEARCGRRSAPPRRLSPPTVSGGGASSAASSNPSSVGGLRLGNRLRGRRGHPGGWLRTPVSCASGARSAPSSAGSRGMLAGSASAGTDSASADTRSTRIAAGIVDGGGAGT